MSQKIAVQVLGFSYYSNSGIGKFILENEEEKLELDMLHLAATEETNSLDFNLNKYFEIILSCTDAVKFFSCFSKYEHKNKYIPTRKGGYGINVQEINPDLKISLKFENVENEERNGLCFSSGLKFSINFAHFQRAEWEQNIVKLRFLP